MYIGIYSMRNVIVLKVFKIIDEPSVILLDFCLTFQQAAEAILGGVNALMKVKDKILRQAQMNDKSCTR